MDTATHEQFRVPENKKKTLHLISDFSRENICIQWVYLQDKSTKILFPCTCHKRGWSGGAMVLGKLPVPGRPANLDYSRARAYCACSGCGWGLFGYFFSRLSFLFSFSLSLGDGPI